MTESGGHEVGPAQREEHRRWLLELTGIPTATGKEHRVARWIERWAAERPDLALTRDPHGNLLVARKDAVAAPGLLITAHMDHPAFVVESVLGEPGDSHTLALTFRGGVMDPYFKDARIVVHTADGRRMPATLIDAEAPKVYRRCLAELDAHVHAGAVKVGDVATWDLPDPEIREGLLMAPACDDLAALAAAIGAMDALRRSPQASHVGLLFTRAEEVGFIGAIAACKSRSIPEGARLIALENSRAFADSPIGGGPIVRVGDRSWIFSPALTGAIAKVAEGLAAERTAAGRPFKWQRKLMPGGTCEATCFGAYGWDATCLCLPLGNYHNMGNLDEVQAGDESAAQIAPESIAMSDYEGLVDLLMACALRLGDVEPLSARMDRLYDERAFVLGDDA